MKDEVEILFSDKKLESKSFRCANCGGKTVYKPELQKLQCEYCFSVFDVPKNEKITEQPIEDLLTKAKVWSGTDVIRCESCGAKEIVKKGQISKICSFCGSSNVVKTKEIVGMKPQGVCPFEKSGAEAEVCAKKWAKKKWFAPRAFKKNVKTEKLHGVYSPVFTFDCKTDTTYHGTLAKRETEVYYRDGKAYTRSKTRTFGIKGKHTRFFDDLIVRASQNISEIVMRGLEPFPTNNASKYSQSFLSGYTANTYSKDGEQTWKDCKNIMSMRIKSEILRRYDYTSVISFSSDTNYLETKFKYILLPIYIGHFEYRKKLYNFYINGVTGKVVGKTPKSPWKILLVVLLALGLAVLFVYLFFILPAIYETGDMLDGLFVH